MLLVCPQNFVQALSFITLGTTVIPGRNEKQRLCKVLGGKKVYYEYGRCANGESLVTVAEMFAKVNTSQFLYCL